MTPALYVFYIFEKRLQVLEKAIKVFGLELVNLNSSDERAAAARTNPT